jgi:hypothetical protein
VAGGAAGTDPAAVHDTTSDWPEYRVPIKARRTTYSQAVPARRAVQVREPALGPEPARLTSKERGGGQQRAVGRPPPN